MEGVSGFEVGLNIEDTDFSKSGSLMSRNLTLSIEMVHEVHGWVAGVESAEESL